MTASDAFLTFFPFVVIGFILLLGLTGIGLLGYFLRPKPPPLPAPVLWTNGVVEISDAAAYCVRVASPFGIPDPRFGRKFNCRFAVRNVSNNRINSLWLEYGLLNGTTVVLQSNVYLKDLRPGETAMYDQLLDTPHRNCWPFLRSLRPEGGETVYVNLPFRRLSWLGALR
jgi:hypothetical protein